jgi:hypothetical protein
MKMKRSNRMADDVDYYFGTMYLGTEDDVEVFWLDRKILEFEMKFGNLHYAKTTERGWFWRQANDDRFLLWQGPYATLEEAKLNAAAVGAGDAPADPASAPEPPAGTRA